MKAEVSGTDVNFVSINKMQNGNIFLAICTKTKYWHDDMVTTGDDGEISICLYQEDKQRVDVTITAETKEEKQLFDSGYILKISGQYGWTGMIVRELTDEENDNQTILWQSPLPRSLVK